MAGSRTRVQPLEQDHEQKAVEQQEQKSHEALPVGQTPGNEEGQQETDRLRAGGRHIGAGVQRRVELENRQHDEREHEPSQRSDRGEDRRSRLHGSDRINNWCTREQYSLQQTDP